ncbi:hypothetical protein HOU00_gp040 [Caulobacter phage CcrPW]|uniref:Uncharacterized protein n=1 Tax=Caulobacter phage CcrPW TaxID=2283271 RepID=A0A385ECZ9_9CAUD|nr:hypothetical protein HOU00_gp040 [Caulobacter phage CcrPW]AXQ68579.1 hypothetical protein CcrPW_gp040 [Caulobacter phage CcrPW]
MVWNLASAPEEGCCDLIPGIQSDILSLQEAVANLQDPDVSYLADPGNFVPAFMNNL